MSWTQISLATLSQKNVFTLSQCFPVFIGFSSLNFRHPFESDTPIRDVLMDEQLMPSRDVTTRKPGSDFDWLIVRTFALLCLIMNACMKFKISTIFVIKSRIALAFDK